MRQEVERPGQRVGGRLVTSIDEGDDVGPHVRLGDGAAVFRVPGGHEKGQEIPRCLIAVAEKLSTFFDDRIDRRVEKLERATPPPAPQPRHESGRAQ